MMEKNKLNFEVKEEKGIKNTFLYVRNLTLNAESYECKILQEENIENLIKFQIVFDGENRILKYDVSNTLSIEDYVKGKKLKKEDICFIIDSIDAILSSIENYLISENSLSLDLRMIRIVKERRGKVSLKFLPIPNYHSDFSYELSKFLIRILRYVDVDDKNALTLAYGLFVRSSKDNYTISDLMELVDTVRDRKNLKISDIDVDALNEYDENLACEVVDESREVENLESINIDEIEVENKKTVTKVENKSDEIIMDDNTRDIIRDELLDNFDDTNITRENKIINFKNKLLSMKPKKTLNGHIHFDYFKAFSIPVICLIFPMLFYLIYGTSKFMKFLPIIVLYEIVLATLMMIVSIKSTPSND